MPDDSSLNSAPVYRIGAVARLTGIPAETLRVWERRYGLVAPERGQARFRLYARDDVARLALIKRLVDAGNAIGTVARLSLAELQARMEAGAAIQQTARSALATEPCRAAVMGDALPVRLQELGGESGIEIVALGRDLGELEDALALVRPDALLLELPTVDRETSERVRRLMSVSGAGRAIVVYAFGTRADVRRLQVDGILTFRAPVDPEEVQRVCVATPVAPIRPLDEPDTRFPVETGQELPPRRYSGEVLARFAARNTSIACECPRHLADLVLALGAFETYSGECESRNPEDAALHSYLHGTAARARAMMEEALARVVRADGIEI